MKELGFAGAELGKHPELIKTPWSKVRPEMLGEEVLRRNGRFQIMLSFMRLSLMAAVVTDSTGRLIFINTLAEHYWRVRLWDIRGKDLSEVMRLSTDETDRSRKERDRILRGATPEVFMEHFHNGGQRISMLCVPFPDDEGETLMAAFILPHPGVHGVAPTGGF